MLPLLLMAVIFQEIINIIDIKRSEIVGSGQESELSKATPFGGAACVPDRLPHAERIISFLQFKYPGSKSVLYILYSATKCLIHST